MPTTTTNPIHVYVVLRSAEGRMRSNPTIASALAHLADTMGLSEFVESTGGEDWLSGMSALAEIIAETIDSDEPTASAFHSLAVALTLAGFELDYWLSWPEDSWAIQIAINRDLIYNRVTAWLADNHQQQQPQQPREIASL